MTEETRNHDELSSESDYEAPAIEEVVTRENIEREVAYAGLIGPSNNVN
jgi:hypothetical protein